MKSLKNHRNCGTQMIEIGILLMIANFLTAIFVWQSILGGWKIKEGGQFFFYALVQKGSPELSLGFDQAGGYIGFLNMVFSFLGNKEELVVISNLILQFLGVAFFYGGVRLVLGSFLGCIFAAIAAVCSVVAFSVTSDVPMHFTWGIMAFFFFFLAKTVVLTEEKENAPKQFILFLLGGMTGILLFYDLTGIFLSVSLCFFSLMSKKREAKGKVADLLSVLSGASFVFLLMISFLYPPGNELLEGVYKWYGDRMIFYHNSKEMWKEFLIVSLFFFFYIAVSLIVLLRKRKAEKTFLLQEKEDIFSFTDKEREEVVTKENTSKETVVKEEKCVKENSVLEERQLPKPAVKLLENPLPLPKKHRKKEMKYAFEPSTDQMHYDLNNYDVSDDYDLK